LIAAIYNFEVALVGEHVTFAKSEKKEGK